MPIPNPVLAENPEPRAACVLLLDTSSSMEGPPIQALNDGLRVFQLDLQGDPLARLRVEVAIVTFGQGGCRMTLDFTSAADFVAPVLTTGGNTPMGEAIDLALDMVHDRKLQYRHAGLLYYRPWVLMITDGAPNPDSPWRQAAQRVQAAMQHKEVTFFAIGVEGADMKVLSEITPRSLKLHGLSFRELFLWLSQSQRRVSATEVGVDAQTPLSPVTFGSPV